MQRNIQRFKNAAKNVEVGKLSGAVGNFANNEPFIQEYVCKQLGISEANIATQVIQRDVHAEYFATLALIGTTIEKIATEIRHLQRTEVHEVEEMFAKGQKGSSAMPHKRNPIASENICGCARVLRGYMVTAYENISLWHERDISHSSTERIILPDATTLLDYMLNRYANVLNNLIVYPEQMLKNINLTNGIIFAQRVMNKLITEGYSREQAYDTVQPIAMEAYNGGVSFKDLLIQNKVITKTLSNKDIDGCFSLDYYFKKINYIYKKVGI
jgi:adenylosuccinate lyase